jgi:hypothetical protein
VTAGLSDRMRQILAGLVVLAVLVVSAGQVVAVPLVGSSPSDRTHHSENQTLMTQAIAAHDDDRGSPCKHHSDSHGLACCIAGDCSMLSSWLPVATPALLPAAPRALIYRDTVAPPPDDMGAAPAVPPPRHMV